MYAEVRFFDDDGSPKNKKPIFVHSNDIRIRTYSECGDKIIIYGFNCEMSERLPADPKEIYVLDKIEEAYKKGFEEGKNFRRIPLDRCDTLRYDE